MKGKIDLITGGAMGMGRTHLELLAREDQGILTDLETQTG